MPQLLMFRQTLSGVSKPVDDFLVRNQKRARAIWIALFVAAGYYVGTLVGFALTPPGATVSALWPPNAILFAGLLLVPRKYWWISLLAVLPVHLATQLRADVPLWRSVGWFISNSSEAMLGAYFVSRFSGSKPVFDSVRGIVVFLTFGFVLAPLVTSFLDAAVVVATKWDANYWTMWTRRLFSNMLGILAIVPPVVIIGGSGMARLRKTRPTQYAELAVVLTGVFLISIYIFGMAANSPKAPALIYAPLPLLLWAAVRIGPGALSGSLLIVAVVSIFGAMHGRGPFASVSTRENVLYLQISTSMVALPLMLLAAMLSERRTREIELRDSKAKLMEAQEHERRRIASELHDDVAQQLALAQIRLEQIKAESGLPPRMALDRLSDQLSAISDDIREISHGLYPSHLQHLGLAPALTRLSREICKEKNVFLDVAPAMTESIPADISLALYRVAQEALHNIEKHSRARRVAIELKHSRDGVTLRIRDDGIGFDSDQDTAAGLGIDSMRERLRSIGGELHVKSAPMRGTEIEALAPLERPGTELSETG